MCVGGKYMLVHIAPGKVHTARTCQELLQHPQQVDLVQQMCCPQVDLSSTETPSPILNFLLLKTPMLSGMHSTSWRLMTCSSSHPPIPFLPLLNDLENLYIIAIISYLQVT